MLSHLCRITAVLMLLTIAAPLVATGDSVSANAANANNGNDNASNSGAVATKPAAPLSSAKERSQALLITPEREAAAVEFARIHHQELVALLNYLKRNLPKEHGKAIRDLYRTSERLAEMRSRGDDERYQLELEAWKVQSRAQLLAARVKMGGDERLRIELTALVNKQFDLRMAILERERAKAAERVAKLDEQLNKLENSRAQFVERQLKLLTKQSKNAAGKTKPRAANQRTSDSN